MIGSRKMALFWQIIPGTAEVILCPCAPHGRLRFSVAVDRLPAFQHAETKAARKRYGFQRWAKPPFSILHIEMASHVMTAALGVQDGVRNSRLCGILALPECMKAQGTRRTFW